MGSAKCYLPWKKSNWGREEEEKNSVQNIHDHNLEIEF